jgi:uncharacterized protein (DUF2062 family)
MIDSPLTSDSPKTSAPKSFWQRRIVALIIAQLKQGITPAKIALTIALGITLGIFPILGATTILCLAAGFAFKLNQPIMQAINWLISALQLSLILVFVRIGEWLVNAPPVTFSVPELIKKFNASPRKFMQEFGLTGLHGIAGWFLVAPFLIPVIYFSVLPPLKKLASLNVSTSNHAE